MYLDSLPNTTSASLCTSVGEAEQQGGEDERSYQLTVWELLAHFLSDSCRWSLAWQDLPESPSATPVGEAQLWPPCGAWGGITPLAPQMGWQEGREACWALLNVFFLVLFLFFCWSFFFFPDGSMLENAETVQAKMVLELAVSSGVEKVPS